jgi:hypothetical protein
VDAFHVIELLIAFPLHELSQVAARDMITLRGIECAGAMGASADMPQ